MIQVLIVEDDAVKYGKLYNALVDGGIEGTAIQHVVSASMAVDQLRHKHFELMILDINLPRVLGEPPQRGAGIQVLRNLARDDRLKRPTYILGATAYEDALEEFGPEFTDHLWTVLRYSDDSDSWVSQINEKIRYIKAAYISRRFSDGSTFGCDLVILSALSNVEQDAVKQLPCDWQTFRLMHDETHYVSGTFSSCDNVNRTVIAGCAPRMGMPAAAVLASKMIQQFRPRLVLMVGICAGRVDSVSLGDLIIGDPVWDCGSGKIFGEGEIRFRPDPHQLDLDPEVAELIKDMTRDRLLLASIKGQYVGPKPRMELSAHLGPLASGAAVVTDPTAFDALLSQHRKILGLEMEAYGVAAAARGNGQPRPACLIVKGVSDHADLLKVDDVQHYAASNSAFFGLEAARRLLSGKPLPAT